MRKLSWKPIRRGRTYCSPACGHGCTYAEYLHAVGSAAALCNDLERIHEGWKPSVWENAGWHFSAISACGRLKIHGTHAFLSKPNETGGRWAEHGETPATSVQAVLESARKELSEIKALLKGFEHIK